VLNLGLQNVSGLVQGKHFQIGRLMEGSRKMCVFQWKTSETVRDTAKVTINHQQEIAYALSDDMKIIDLG